MIRAFVLRVQTAGADNKPTVFFVFVCRMIERLQRWLSLSESMGNRQHLLKQRKTSVDGVEGGMAAEPSSSTSSSHELAQHDTTTTTSPENRDTSPSELQGSASGSQPRWEPSPEGHPQFPLLPMSKGFILTLRKSLARLDAALQKLLTSLEPEARTRMSRRNRPVTLAH